ncbi:MAG: GGDEF domain-containing protein [Bacillota bacterium]
MFRNTLTLIKAGRLSNQTSKIQGRYFLLALLLFLLVLLFQPFLTIPVTLQQQLLPALAVTTLMVAYFFNLKGLLIALAVNTAAGTLAFYHWLGSHETIYAVFIALIFYTSAASAVIAYFKNMEQTKKKNLEWLSAIDCLTETYNHRFFQSRLAEEAARSRRNGQPLSLVFVDIDHFKQYNDLNGHIMGDLALKKSAAFLNKKTRIHDIVCRYGGDEFVIILPDCSAKNAAVFAERLINSYNRLMFPSKDTKTNALSLSIGISDYPGSSSNITDLINQADKALFMAKEAGRNQVRVYNTKENTGENKNNSFCYNSCKGELIESYRNLIRDLARPGDGAKDGKGNGRSNGGANEELLVGKAIGAGHGKIDRDRLSSCLEGIKVH